MPTIKTLIEPRRGCGYRKPGGFYLIGSGSSSPCCKLPFPLTDCVCCGNTIKFTRGFQWISSTLFTNGEDCIYSQGVICPLGSPGNKMGLMWVGEQFYPTTADFMREANAIGVSKRMGSIPKEVKAGTWVALAHPKAMQHLIIDKLFRGPITEPIPLAGVFYVFRVTAIQYVVTGEETETALDEIEARGIELVTIKKEGEQLPLIEIPGTV